MKCTAASTISLRADRATEAKQKNFGHWPLGTHKPQLWRLRHKFCTCHVTAQEKLKKVDVQKDFAES
jgi:hypothetical protein